MEITAIFLTALQLAEQMPDARQLLSEMNRKWKVRSTIIKRELSGLLRDAPTLCTYVLDPSRQEYTGQRGCQEAPH